MNKIGIFNKYCHRVFIVLFSQDEDSCLALNKKSLAIKVCPQCKDKICGFHSISHVCTNEDLEMVKKIITETCL